MATKPAGAFTAEDIAAVARPPLTGGGTVPAGSLSYESLLAKYRAKPVEKPSIGAELVKGLQDVPEAVSRTVGSVESYLGETFDNPDLAAAGRRRMEQAMATMQRPAIEGLDDIEGVGDFLRFLAYQVPTQAPSLGASAAATLGGAAIGAFGGPGGVAVGGGIGGGIASYILNAAETYDRARREGASDEDAWNYASAAALLQAPLDVIAPLGFAKRILSPVTGQLTREGSRAMRGLVRRVLQEGGIGALKEMPTEALQELIGAAAANMAAEKPDLLTRGDLIEAAGAGVVGGALGGGAGALTGVIPDKGPAVPPPAPGAPAGAFPENQPPPPAPETAQPTVAPAPGPASAAPSARPGLAPGERVTATVGGQTRTGVLEALTNVAVDDPELGAQATPYARIKWDDGTVFDDALEALPDLAKIQVTAPTREPEREVGTGTRTDPVKVETPEDIAQAAAATAATSPENDLPDPTDPQKGAGNYSKTHIKLHGFDISIENPKGSTRSGVGPDGTPWSVEMPAHYGYIKRSEGADGDQIDVYVGDDPMSRNVFVVDQIDPATGKFDEHKVMLGFGSIEDAAQAYSDGFSDGSGPDRAGTITKLTVGEFRTWVKNLDTKKPLSWEPPGALGAEPTVVSPGADTSGVVSSDEGGSAPTPETGPGAPGAPAETPEHPGLIIKSLETGKTTELQPAGTRPPEKPEKPLSDDERDAKVAANNRTAFRGSLEVAGNAQWAGSRYEILALPNGKSFYYRRSSGRTSVEKGPGYPAWWTREQAIEAATLDAFGPQPAAAPTPAPSAGEKPDDAKAKRLSEVARKVVEIQSHLSQGNEVRLSTQTRVFRLNKPEHITMRSDGAYILRSYGGQSGKPKYDFIFDHQVDQLHAQVTKAKKPEPQPEPEPQAPADELAALIEARDTRESAAGDWLEAQGYVKKALSGEKLTILPKGRRRIAELQAQKPAEAPAADTREAVKTIASGFAKAFAEGRGFKTIVEARKFAEELAGEALPPKVVEEAIEAGIVMRAREITADNPPEAVYDLLVELYAQQPLLAQRTSTSVENQAYSTPAPLAYLASRLAGIDSKATVYEPSAGNGMLLIDAAARNIRANELNPDRAAALEMVLPGAKITNEDAMTVDQGGPYDVVIANPPFGKVKDDKGNTRRYQLEGTSTPEIDYGISWRALQAMKEGGRAVLIVGGAQGDPTERRDSYRADNRRPFFKKLYDTYNVVDHFTVDGKLYERQGAGWPVDVIVIEGRGKSALTLPMAEAPQVLGSWAELKGKLDGQGRLDTAGQPVGAGKRPAAGAAGGTPDTAGIPSPAGGADQPDGGTRGPRGGARPARPVRGGGAVQPGQGAEGGGRDPGGVLGVAAGTGSVPLAGGGAAPGAQPGDGGAPEGGDAGGVPGAPVSGPGPDLDSVFDDALDDVFGKAEEATETAAPPAAPQEEAASEPEADGTTPDPQNSDQFDASDGEFGWQSLGYGENVEYSIRELVSEERGVKHSWRQIRIFDAVRGRATDVFTWDIVGVKDLDDLTISTSSHWWSRSDDSTTDTDEVWAAHGGDIMEMLEAWRRERSEPIDITPKPKLIEGPKKPPKPKKKGGGGGPRGGGAPKPPPPRTPGQSAKDALKNTAMGLDDVASGLTALFGGGKTLGSGLAFDEDTYAKAKPLFIAGVKHFAQAGKDVAEMVRALVRALATTYGMAREAIERMRPYVMRFVTDVQSGKISLEDEPAPAPQPKKPARRENTEAETNFQVRYEPTSAARYAVGTLVPRNMQTAITRSLAKLKERVGDIDAYVAEKLGYTLDEMLGTDARPGYFSAEQVDALALAIDNVEGGAGFIIGDQTGVGKGRFVAAMLRYALQNGRTPVFVTKDPGLYADMVRDLRDIGMGDISGRILITNNDIRGEKAIPLSAEDITDVLQSQTPAKQRAAVNYIAENGNLPDGYDVLFTTYSQLQYGPEGRVIPRQNALMALAPNAMIVLDESHEAGGTENRRVSKSTGEEIPTRADFVRAMLGEARGVVYSSATYAKNPTVMSLYFKTDLSLAVENISDLATAIRAGGVPLQQVAANMLVEAGQYARRERSYEGVSMELDVLPTDAAAARRSADSLQRIFTLDVDFMQEIRQQYADEEMSQGGGVGQDNAVGAGSAMQIGFSSIMHNVVSQMLLSLKAQAVVDKAITLAQNGEKPIIALSNTNESIIDDFVQDTNARPGDKVDITFNAIMERYLKRLRRVTLKDSNDNPYHVWLTDADIVRIGGQDALDAYREVERHVKNADLSALPGSPIDYVLDRLNAAGVKSGEITGREKIVQNGTYKLRKASSAEKKKAMNAYNSGKLDALVINRSGSTGFSMHATDKPGNDGKKRHMIVLQPDPNIDTFMQMLGRIHRTGQIKLPGYTIGVSDLAVEKRLAAVLMRKMASLNANTTASKRSAVSLDNVTDFMNQYGDEVVADFLRENTEIANLLDMGVGQLPDGIAARFTGRLAVLPPEQVAEIYEQIEEAYRDYIESLDRLGMNALEAKTLDLDAKTLSTAVLAPGRGDGDSPFSQDAVVETVDVRRLGKPYTIEEVQAEVAKTLGGKTPRGLAREQIAELQEKMDGYRAGLEEKLEVAQQAQRDARTATQVEKAERAAGRLAAARDAADRDFERISGLIESNSPGAAVTLAIRDGDETRTVPAISLGADIRKVKDNPTAASTISMRFAIADAGREIRVPLSQMLGDAPRYSTTEAGREATEAAFEAGGQEAREQRQIITGNLVSGFSRFRRGQIVMFTDSRGDVRQGVLLPRDFDARAQARLLPVEFKTGEQIIEFLRVPDTRMVKTDENPAVMAITWDANARRFNLAVNTRGGRPYYLNQAVRGIIGDFEQRRGQKVFRNTATPEQLPRIIQIYQENLGTRFITTAHKDEARKIVGEAMGEERPATPGEDEAPTGLEEPTREPEDTAGGLRVFPRFDDYNDHVREAGATTADELHEAAAAYVEKRGKATGWEFLVALGADGQAIDAITSREPGTVDFSRTIRDAMNDPASRLVIHHNHPLGAPLSVADLRTLSLPGVATIFAHGQRAGEPAAYYGASLTAEFAEAMWNVSLGQPWGDRHRSSIADFFRYTEQEMFGRAKPYVIEQNKAGRLGLDDAGYLHFHVFAEALAERGVIDYVSTYQVPEHLRRHADRMRQGASGAVADFLAAQGVRLEGKRRDLSDGRRTQPVRLARDVARLQGGARFAAGQRGEQGGSDRTRGLDDPAKRSRRDQLHEEVARYVGENASPVGVRETAAHDLKRVVTEAFTGVKPDTEKGVTLRRPEPAGDVPFFMKLISTPELIFRKYEPVLYKVWRKISKLNDNQSKWINEYRRQAGEITSGLSSDQIGQTGEMMFAGDAAEREFTAEELAQNAYLDEDGNEVPILPGVDSIDEKVRRAYTAMRKLIEKIGRHVDMHERKMLPTYRARKETLVRKLARVRQMKDAEFRALYRDVSDLLSKYRRADYASGTGEDPTTLATAIEAKEAEIYGRLMDEEGNLTEAGELFAKDYEELKVIEAKLQATSVRRRKGYFPHKFFGSWAVYRVEKVEKIGEDGRPVMDRNGEPELEDQYNLIAHEKNGFYSDVASATRAANAYAANNPGSRIVAQPVAFKFPNAQATELSDAAYFRFLRNVSQAFEMTLEEAREGTRDVARRRFRRRIAGFKQKRQGIEGFSRNFSEVLEAHIGETMRYVTMDEAKYLAISAIERLGLSERRSTVQERPVLSALVNQWFRDVNGQKQVTERFVDEIFDKPWATPLTSALASGGTAFLLAGGLTGNPLVGALLGSYVGYRFYRGVKDGGDFKSRAITGAMLEDMAHLKLGAFFNLFSPLVNLSQTLTNTLPVLGVKHTTVGLQRYMAAMAAKAAGKETPDVVLLRRANIDTAYKASEMSPHLFQSEPKWKRASLFFFSQAEMLNRGTAYLGAIAKAEAEGMTPGAAKRYAENVMLRTQFDYSNVNKPELLRNVFLRVPGQFKNFVAQQLAFIYGLDHKTELPKFLFSLFLLAGFIGLPFLDLLDELIQQLLGESPLDEVKRQVLLAQAEGGLSGTMATFFSRGIPGLLGVDLSSRAGMEKFLPTEARDWAGPWWTTMSNAVAFGEQNATVVDQIRNLSSGLGAPLKAIEAAANGMPLFETLLTDPAALVAALGDDKAAVTNPWLRGKIEYEPTTAEIALKAVGGSPLREAQMRDIKDIVTRRTEEIRAGNAEILDAVVAAVRNGSPGEIQALLREAAAAGRPISLAQVKNALRAANLPRMERFIKQTPEAYRPEVRALFRAIAQDV